MSRTLTEYVPWCDWKRNHGAMKDWKLLDVLAEYEFTQETGIMSDATLRVMENGGDIDDNYQHCRKHALDRGLIAR